MTEEAQGDQAAAVLREAAALMREHAEVEGRLRDGDPYFTSGEMSRYERAWHPAVALAVADWLDGIAICLTNPDIGGQPVTAEVNNAIAVAATYLGRTP